ncbi:MAG: translesion error-prone DNA polymerase V autoproteolytic subunit [Rhodospirillales bacterium]
MFTSRVSAGFPSPAEDFADGVLDLNDLIERPAATFIVRVSGWSMSGAGIFDGDLLIVDRSLKSRSGQIVVAVTAGEMVVKRLRLKGGCWWLVPEAPEHDEFKAVEMGEDSEIWGVVKNVVRCLT